MREIFDKLTEYTLALREGLTSTHEANESPLLTSRLAAAGEMFALLHSSGKIESIHELVRSETRAHGWSFISGQAGETIANKWVALTSEIGIS